MERNNSPTVAHGVISLGDDKDRLQIVCGACSIKGRRPHQEDMLMMHVDPSCTPPVSVGDSCVSKGTLRGLSMVGIFDGHGGKRCSKFAAQTLPHNLLLALSSTAAASPSSSSPPPPPPPSSLSLSSSPPSQTHEDVSSALRVAYLMTHEDFARMARGAGEERPKTRQRLHDALSKTAASRAGQVSIALDSHTQPCVPPLPLPPFPPPRLVTATDRAFKPLATEH